MKGTTPALVKLVAFAVVTVLATFLLATTIAGIGFGNRSRYRALFTDVTGLLPGDDVRIAGVKVGKVESIKIVQTKYAQVDFSVQKNRPLSRSTEVRIRYRNLVGQRYIALTEGPGSAVALRPGERIPLSRTQPALDLTELFNGFKPLFQALTPKDVNRLSLEIVRTLQGEGGTMKSLLAHTASLTSAIADRDAVIGRVVDNLNAVLATVDERDQKLSQLIVALQRFTSGLAADRAAIGASLVSINDVADATAGLLRDTRPALKSDIDRLGAVSKNLATNEKVVDGVLKRLPTKLNRITRTATYGSWFNFYLCDFDGRVVLPAGVTYTPEFHSTDARCNP